MQNNKPLRGKVLPVRQILPVVLHAAGATIVKGEIIHVHVGQAGVQIGNACWELYCLEHGIDPCGCLYDYQSDGAFSTFFAFSRTPKVVPRAVMVDSEPTVIDEVRTGTYGHLFKPDTLIAGKDDSGSNFARGYNTVGSDIIELTMNSIRCITEACSNLKGFLFFRSIGGGTGSGLGDRLLEECLDEYGKATKMDFTIFPSSYHTPLTVEPYNSLLSTHCSMDTIECSFILDNETLYSICESQLDVLSPTFTNINRIIGQAISGLTASQRFYGSANVGFAEFQTNLVPFPRIHFPIMSYAPLVTMFDSYFTELTTDQLTLAAFQTQNQLTNCNPLEGKYMSCVMLYRGNFGPAEVHASLRSMKMKTELKFVDWSPSGFKIGINNMPPCAVPGGDIGQTDKAVVTLMNNTIICQSWCEMLAKFNNLYSRRAFLHHFTAEGLDEAVFEEASEDICTLINDYKEVEDINAAGTTENNQKPKEMKASGNCCIMIPVCKKEECTKKDTFEMNNEQNICCKGICICCEKPSINNYRPSVTLRHHHAYFNTDKVQFDSMNNDKNSLQPVSAEILKKAETDLHNEHDRSKDSRYENVKKSADVPQSNSMHKDKNEIYLNTSLKQSFCYNSQNLNKSNSSEGHNIAEGKVHFALPDKNYMECKSDNQSANSLSVLNVPDSTQINNSSDDLSDGILIQDIRSTGQKRADSSSLQQQSGASDGALMYKPVEDSDKDYNKNECLTLKSLSGIIETTETTYFSQGTTDARSNFENRNKNFQTDISAGHESNYLSPGNGDLNRKYTTATNGIRRSNTYSSLKDHHSFIYGNKYSNTCENNNASKIRKTQSAPKLLGENVDENFKDHVHLLQEFHRHIHILKENERSTSEIGCNTSSELIILKQSSSSEIKRNTSSIGNSYVLPKTKSLRTLDQGGLHPSINMASLTRYNDSQYETVYKNHPMNGKSIPETAKTQQLPLHVTSEKQRIDINVVDPSKRGQILTSPGITEEGGLLTKKTKSPLSVNFLIPGQYSHQSSACDEDDYRDKRQMQQVREDLSRKTSHEAYSTRKRKHLVYDQDCAASTTGRTITSKVERSTSCDKMCLLSTEQNAKKPISSTKGNNSTTSKSAKQSSDIQNYTLLRNCAVNTENLSETAEEIQQSTSHVKVLLPLIQHRSPISEKNNLPTPRTETNREHQTVLNMSKMSRSQGKGVSISQQTDRCNSLQETRSTCYDGKSNTDQAGSSIRDNSLARRKRACTSQVVSHPYPDENVNTRRKDDICITSSSQHKNRSEATLRESNLCMKKQSGSTTDICFKSTEEVLYLSKTQQSPKLERKRIIYSPERNYILTPKVTKRSRSREGFSWPLKWHGHKKSKTRSHRLQNQSTQTRRTCTSPETRNRARGKEVGYAFKQHQSFRLNDYHSLGNKKQSKRLQLQGNSLDRKTSAALEPYYRDNSSQESYQSIQIESTQRYRANIDHSSSDFSLRTKGSLNQYGQSYRVPVSDYIYRVKKKTNCVNSGHEKSRSSRTQSSDSYSSIRDPVLEETRMSHTLEPGFVHYSGRTQPQSPNNECLHYNCSLSDINESSSKTSQDFTESRKNDYSSFDRVSNVSKMPSTSEFCSSIGEDEVKFLPKLQKPLNIETSPSPSICKANFHNSCKSIYSTKKDLVEKATATHGFFHSKDDLNIAKNKWHSRAVSNKTSAMYPSSWKLQCNADHYSNEVYCVGDGTGMHGISEHCHAKLKKKVTDSFSDYTKTSPSIECHKRVSYFISPQSSTSEVNQLSTDKELSDKSTYESEQQRISIHNISNTDFSSHGSEYYHGDIQNRTQEVVSLDRPLRSPISQNYLSPSKSATDQSLKSTRPRHLYDCDTENLPSSWKLPLLYTRRSVDEISALGSDTHSVTLFCNTSKDHLHTPCTSNAGLIRKMQTPLRSKYGRRESNRGVANLHSNLYESYSDGESMPMESKCDVMSVVKEHKIYSTKSSEIDSYFITSSQQLNETALLRQHIAMRKRGKLMTKIPGSKRVKRYRVESLQSVCATSKPRIIDRLQHKFGNGDSIMILKTNSSDDIPEKYSTESNRSLSLSALRKLPKNESRNCIEMDQSARRSEV